MYPEYIFDPGEYAAFLRDRRGAVVGRQLAELYGFKVGDTIPLKSSIYPALGVHRARDLRRPRRDDDHAPDVLPLRLPERADQEVFPRRADQAGVFIVGIADSSAAATSRAHRREFKELAGETLTETEKAFTLAFVAMIETIVVAIEGVSYVVILIIMAVSGQHDGDDGARAAVRVRRR